MPGTTIRSAQNTYTTAVSGGTTIADNQIIEIGDWARARQPRMTPILDKLGKPITRNQRPFYFGQSEHPAHRSLVATNLAQAATTLAVTTGDGVLFQGAAGAGTMAWIYNQISGSSPARYDYTTKEQVWVQGVSTDNLTIVRAQGGTSDIAHPAGALIELGPPHEAQLQDHTISPVKRGFRNYNHFSRLGGGVKMDKAFQNMPNWEVKGDQLANDIANEQDRLNLFLEKTVIHSGRSAGNPSTPLAESMGGFLSFITTNVYNQSGATLSVAGLETAVRDLWNKVDESAAKVLLMSANTAAVFDTFLNPLRRYDGTETTATYFLERVKMRWGVYDIGVSRWMPDGVIAIVDFSEMSLVRFEGLDWHTSDHPVNGDYVWRSISGDFSLLIQNESSMGLVTNFNDDLAQYAGRQYLS